MKTRKIGLILLVVAALITISGSSPSNARASTSGELSGGKYMLTIQTTAGTPPIGYRLQDATSTTVDPAPGCCCKAHLPCLSR